MEIVDIWNIVKLYYDSKQGDEFKVISIDNYYLILNDKLWIKITKDFSINSFSSKYRIFIDYNRDEVREVKEYIEVTNELLSIMKPILRDMRLNTLFSPLS